MLSVKYWKNVEFVLVASILLLIMSANSVLAKKGSERVTKSTQVGVENQKSTNTGQASGKVSTSSQKARQETKLRTSERNNSRRDIKTGVRQTTKVIAGKQPNETKCSSSSTRKSGRIITSTHVVPRPPRPRPPRPFRRHRKRQSFDTRERISFNHYYKEPPKPPEPTHHILKITKQKINDQNHESTWKGKKDGPEK